MQHFRTRFITEHKLNLHEISALTVEAKEVLANESSIFIDAPKNEEFIGNIAAMLNSIAEGKEK